MDFDVHLEDGGVVNEAVDVGDSHRRVVKHLAPVAERLVRGDHQRAAFIASGNEFEQDAGPGLVFADIGEIIEDQHIEAVELGDCRREMQRLSFCLQRCTISVVRINSTW